MGTNGAATAWMADAGCDGSVDCCGMDCPCWRTSGADHVRRFRVFQLQPFGT